MYRISSQFSEFYNLDSDTYRNDPRYAQLRKWLIDTNQQHSTCWLTGEQINHNLVIQFDSYLKKIQAAQKNIL